MNLTKNFTVEELQYSSTAIKHNIDNTIPYYLRDNAQAVAELAQQIRDVWGAPLKVNSGYRCPKLNKLVGGASNSDHVYAAALDLNAGSKEKNKQLFKTIQNIKGLKWRQLIDEYNYSWIHISINHENNSYKNNQILHI